MRRFVIGFICLLLAIAGANAQSEKVKKEVEEFIKVIKSDKDPKNRTEAINGLAEIAEVRVSLIKPAVPALVASLKDGDVEVRKAAVGVLGQMETYSRDWLPNLLGLLADGEDRVVRIGAINILGGLEHGAKEAVTPLQAIQTKEAAKAEDQRDGELLQAIAGALDGIRDQLAEGYAATLANNKDSEARAKAVAELAKLGQEKIERIKPYIPNLLKGLKDDSTAVRREVIAALGVARPEAGDVMPALIDRLRNVRETRSVHLAVIALLASYGNNAADAVPYLEVIQTHESKKSDKDRDKDMIDKVTQAIEAIKKQQ
jgi:HEAT repeat protein